MAAVATFIRHTPKTALQSYFEKEAFHLDPPVNWAAPEREIIKPLLQAVDQMSEMERDRLVTVFDRVAAMSDEVGEAASRRDGPLSFLGTSVIEMPGASADGAWWVRSGIAVFVYRFRG